MTERSFVLLKPDAMSDVRIQQYIFYSLDKYNLSIISKTFISLKPDDITTLWEFTLRDPICKRILELHLTNKVLHLMVVEGEDALSKVCKIKLETRKLYAKSFFSNCLHAPKNKQEYNRDINYLFYGTCSKIKTELIGDTSKFLKFHKLDDNDYCQCADQIYAYYKNNPMPMSSIENNTSDKKYLLYLHDDTIHELVYVVAAIYEFVPGLTVFDSYLICMLAELRETTLLMCSNDNKNIEKIFNQLLKAGIKVSICENENALV